MIKRISKTALIALALVFIQTIGFAADKLPEVYTSQAQLSDLNCAQVINSPWVWMLIVYVAIVAITAFLSAQEKASHHTASH